MQAKAQPRLSSRGAAQSWEHNKHYPAPPTEEEVATMCATEDADRDMDMKLKAEVQPTVADAPKLMEYQRHAFLNRIYVNLVKGFGDLTGEILPVQHRWVVGNANEKLCDIITWQFESAKDGARAYQYAPLPKGIHEDDLESIIQLAQRRGPNKIIEQIANDEDGFYEMMKKFADEHLTEAKTTEEVGNITEKTAEVGNATAAATEKTAELGNATAAVAEKTAEVNNATAATVDESTSLFVKSAESGNTEASATKEQGEEPGTDPEEPASIIQEKEKAGNATLASSPKAASVRMTEEEDSEPDSSSESTQDLMPKTEGKQKAGDTKSGTAKAGDTKSGTAKAGTPATVRKRNKENDKLSRQARELRRHIRDNFCTMHALDKSMPIAGSYEVDTRFSELGNLWDILDWQLKVVTCVLGNKLSLSNLGNVPHPGDGSGKLVKYKERAWREEYDVKGGNIEKWLTRTRNVDDLHAKFSLYMGRHNLLQDEVTLATASRAIEDLQEDMQAQAATTDGFQIEICDLKKRIDKKDRELATAVNQARQAEQTKDKAVATCQAEIDNVRRQLQLKQEELDNAKKALLNAQGSVGAQTTSHQEELANLKHALEEETRSKETQALELAKAQKQANYLKEYAKDNGDVLKDWEEARKAKRQEAEEKRKKTEEDIAKARIELQQRLAALEKQQLDIQQAASEFNEVPELSSLMDGTADEPPPKDGYDAAVATLRTILEKLTLLDKAAKMELDSIKIEDVDLYDFARKTKATFKAWKATQLRILELDIEKLETQERAATDPTAKKLISERIKNLQTDLGNLLTLDPADEDYEDADFGNVGESETEDEDMMEVD